MHSASYGRWLVLVILLCGRAALGAGGSGIVPGQPTTGLSQIARLVGDGRGGEYRAVAAAVLDCRVGYAYYCEYKLADDARQLAEAKARFERAVEQAPKLATSRYLLGSALIAYGRHGDAVRHLDRVPRASELWASAQRLKAFAYGKMAGAHVSITTPEGETSADADPHTFYIDGRRQVTEADRRRWLAKAAECVSAADKVAPDSPEAAYFRASVLLAKLWWRPEERGKPLPEEVKGLMRAYVTTALPTARTYQRFQMALRTSEILVEDLPQKTRRQYNALIAQRCLSRQYRRASVPGRSCAILEALPYLLDISGKVGELLELDVSPCGEVRCVYDKANAGTAARELGTDAARIALSMAHVKRDPDVADRVVVAGRLLSGSSSDAWPAWSQDLADAVHKSLTQQCQKMFWPAPVFERVKKPGLSLLECSMQHKGTTPAMIKDAMRQVRKFYHQQGIPIVCHTLNIQRVGEKLAVKFVIRGFLSNEEKQDAIEIIH